MSKNKLLLLLALLLTAATGAMAQSSTPSVKKLTVPNTWTGDMTTFSAADLPSDFAAVGDDVVTTIPAPTATGNAVLIYGFSGGETKYVEYANGVQSATDSRDFPRDQIYGYVNMMGYEGVYYTAAAGTAAGPKHLITATYQERTRSLEQPLPYATTIGELFEAVTGEHFSDLISTMSSFEMPLTGISSNNTSAVSIGELNGASTPVTVIADGEATISINFGNYAHGIFVSAISPLYANMKSGVKDADKWTVKVGDGQAQALPIGGLKGDGTETVTLQYNGRLKVKGVKATSEAAAPEAAAFAADEYNEASWDDTNKKVVFEKKKATTTPVSVANSDAAVTWGDGWYTVSGNVTITGNVTLTADAHLILQDGATLTINGQLDCRTNKKNLYIYGQKKGDGKLNVTNNSAIANNSSIAINSDWNYRIDIHGGEVTAASTRNIGLNTGYLAVYGGKLTATSGGGNGINFNNTIDVYGGVVEATSNATSGVHYGIVWASDDETLTVYGGKVTATGNGESDDYGNYGSGFRCYVKSGTSGIKFYFSDNGTTWGDGTSYDSATEVGTSYADAATKKRYAKATSEATSDEPAAKPAATVTTAPTGAAIVGVGKTTALVSGGVADGGTLWYAVTTTNTKPASTDGFSDAVPTAQTITASGTVYVWYYVKADDTHTDSEIAATAIEVPVADIVWDATNVFNSAHQTEEVSPWRSDHLTYEGITISFSGENSKFTPYGVLGESTLVCYGDEGDSFTFTAPSGKNFCKIEIINNSDVVFDKYGDWTLPENNKIVWSGTAANAVTLGTVYTVANELNSIAFYLSE